METITPSVPTVHCHSCTMNIEEALDELAGVDSCSVDLATRSVTSPTTPTSWSSRRSSRHSATPAIP